MICVYIRFFTENSFLLFFGGIRGEILAFLGNFSKKMQFLVSRRLAEKRPKESRPFVRPFVRSSVRHAVSRKPFITFFWNFAVS